MVSAVLERVSDIRVNAIAHKDSKQQVQVLIPKGSSCEELIPDSISEQGDKGLL